MMHAERRQWTAQFEAWKNAAHCLRLWRVRDDQMLNGLWERAHADQRIETLSALLEELARWAEAQADPLLDPDAMRRAWSEWLEWSQEKERPPIKQKFPRQEGPQMMLFS